MPQTLRKITLFVLLAIAASIAEVYSGRNDVQKTCRTNFRVALFANGTKHPMNFQSPSTRAARLLGFIFVCSLFFSQTLLAQNIKILINHLGYEKDAPKRAVILGHAGDEVTRFKVLDAESGKELMSANAIKTGPVDHWKNWIFWTADFNGVITEGTYVIECATSQGAVRSFPFKIESNLLEKNTLFDVVAWFKWQRCSGELDLADRNLLLEGSTNRVDVHGGWFDATGDYGKHLSHLSFSTYFNPQQIPATDWSLLKSYEELNRRGDPNFRQYKRRLLDEAL
jgi:hypothetical protein